MSDNVTPKSIDKTIAMINAVSKLKTKGVNIPLLLWGRHGVGKTSIVEQVAETQDAMYVIMNLANLTIEDLLGQLDGKGGYFKPDWLKDTTKKVIYFLDEINRAPKYVLQGIFNFINEGRIHNYNIKQQDMVIAAANPMDEYEVTCFEDPAFLSRFAHVKVAPEQREFVSYLNSKNMKNSIVQQTLKKTVSIYDSNTFDIGFPIQPDNRKLEKAAYIFEYLTKEEIENVGVDLLECLMGYDASAAFLETWRDSNKNQFDAKDILNLSEKEEYPFSDDQIDVINTVNSKMIAYLSKESKLSKKEEKGFVRYFMFIPKDLQVEFGKEIVAINEKLLDLLDVDYTFELLNFE